MGYRFTPSKSVALSVSFLVMLAFQNCAEPSPVSAVPVEQRQTPQNPLALWISKSQITAGEELTLFASGGTPPYYFRVVSGPASIKGVDILQAGGAAGSVVVSVSDSAGLVQSAGVEVVVAHNALPPVTCPLPWGGAIAPGQTVTAFAASVALTCQSQVRTCLANGQLSGSYAYRVCTSNEGDVRGYTGTNCGGWNSGYAVSGERIGSRGVSSASECVAYCQSLGTTSACEYAYVSNGGGSCRAFRGPVSLFRTNASFLATTCTPRLAYAN